MTRTWGTLIAILAACGAPPPPPAPPTVDEQIAAAVDTALECLGSAGVECLTRSPQADGWVALGALAQMDRVPVTLIARELYAGADTLARSGNALRAIRDQAAGAITHARDLSCRTAEIAPAGLEQRRAALLERARALGLERAGLAAILGTLGTASERLRSSRLVRARCAAGDVFALVAPPRRDIPSDADPRAYGGGWQVIVVADAAAPLRCEPLPVTAAPVSDRPASADVVHPWLPVTELEL